MNSLQGRLTAGLFAILVVVFALQWGLVSFAIARVTENYVAQRLGHEIETLLTGIHPENPPETHLDAERIDPVYQRAFSGHYFRIQIGDQVLRSRSLWDRELQVPSLAPGDQQRLIVPGPQNQSLLVLAEGFRKQGADITVAVAEDLSPVRTDIARFQTRYAILTLIVLAALLLAQRLLVRRSLQPLEQARRQLRALDSGELRELNENVPDEIRPLVREINQLMRLTVSRLERSRKAVGNLAHALKTPLTVLRQLSRDPALAEQTETRGALVHQVDAMQRLLERELKRARLAGGGPSGSHFDPAKEIPPLVDVLERAYGQGRRLVDTQLPARHSFAGDREDMLELLGNLMENACKWADNRVKIAVADRPGLYLTVEDDGPGVSEERLQQLGERGTRLDESGEGHGVGLSIVRDIVEQYHGTIEFDRSPELGGLRVRVSLPDMPKG